MTLPRELKLTEYAGKPLLCNAVVSEIDKIAGQWQTVSTEALPLDAAKSAYQLRLNISMDKNSTITLSNGSDEKFACSQAYGCYRKVLRNLLRTIHADTAEC